MGLTLLHSADWHLGSPFSGFPDDRRAFLNHGHRKIPGRILEIAHAASVDMVLLSGDLFDGRPSREWVELMKHTLREFQVPVFVSPGNHDFCGPGSPWLEEVWPENVHIFTAGLEHVVLPELDCRVYGAGYRSMDCPPLLEQFRADGQERYCVAVLHGDPVMRNSPACPVTAAQIRESGLDYLALGHIHKAGSLRAGDTLCGWPGCPMGRGWDEAGEKGVYIVSLEEGSNLSFVPLDGIRFHELEWDAEETSVDALEGILPPAGTEDFFRVTLTGCAVPDVTGLHTRFSHIPNLYFRDRTQPPLPRWEELEEDSLAGTYFRLLHQSGDPAAKLAADISLRILGGREVQLP